MDWQKNYPYKPVIRYKSVHPKALAPMYMTNGAAGFDLACVEDIVLNSSSPMLYSTGLIIAAPEDHMLFITHRSSTPQKYGVTVMNGIVDQDYCGENDVLSLQVRVFNWTLGPIRIPAGTRIAQGVLIPITRGDFILSEEMGVSRGGWGSTGG